MAPPAVLCDVMFPNHEPVRKVIEHAHSGPSVSHGALTRGATAVQSAADIRERCVASIAGWRGVSPSDVDVTPVDAGLTNELHRVSLSSSVPNNFLPRDALFRIFGSGVDQFYSLQQENTTVRMLSEAQLGPAVLAQGDGWRIEEWFYARTLKVQELPNPSVLAQVAPQLARFHKLPFTPGFPAELRNGSAVRLRLRQWADNCEAATLSPELKSRVDSMGLADMLHEARNWLPEHLSMLRTPAGLGQDLVFAHNDVQENNLLLTASGIRMIDFEYAHMNEQAADVANFFCEWCFDYTVPDSPYFSVNAMAYPSHAHRAIFASIYLSEYLGEVVMPDSEKVAQFLSVCEVYTLPSNLLWGLWSVMRAATAPPDGFDFLAHAEARFALYRAKKSSFVPRG